MAIVQSAQFKVPRRAHEPNFVKSEENDVVDIGWAQGLLSDGRPFVAECWAQDQITAMTFFFDATGLDLSSPDLCETLLEREGLAKFDPGPAYVSAQTMTDEAGTVVWSVNMVVGDADSLFATSAVPLRSWKTDRPGDARS
jgi:hypothetical protein